MRDDRVFQGTRILGIVIVPFLLVAFRVARERKDGWR
jgi:hypothetical protein